MFRGTNPKMTEQYSRRVGNQLTSPSDALSSPSTLLTRLARGSKSESAEVSTLRTDSDLAFPNEHAISIISNMASWLISLRADFVYARATEPQFASLKACELFDTFPVAGLRIGWSLRPDLLERLASTASTVIAPSRQNVSALSTLLCVSPI
jgi:hypothetical protein